MNTNIQIPRIALFNEIEEPKDYNIYIFGTDNPLLQREDTFGAALSRYLKEYEISQDMFARMTGIGQGTISRCLNGGRTIQRKYLSAVCIALRLHPFRQMHLFYLTDNIMPGTYGYKNQSDYIVRDCLNGCAYCEGYTLISCNDRMRAIGVNPLTKLTSAMEDGE